MKQNIIECRGFNVKRNSTTEKNERNSCLSRQRNNIGRIAEAIFQSCRKEEIRKESNDQLLMNSIKANERIPKKIKTLKTILKNNKEANQPLDIMLVRNSTILSSPKCSTESNKTSVAINTDT